MKLFTAERIVVSVVKASDHEAYNEAVNGFMTFFKENNLQILI